MEKMLNVRGVQEALNISRDSAYKLMASGEIPILRIGRSIRVSPSNLEKWVSSQIKNNIPLDG